MSKTACYNCANKLFKQLIINALKEETPFVCETVS